MKNYGKVKELILERSILKPISQNKIGIEKGAAVGSDCAFIDEMGLANGYMSIDTEDAPKWAVCSACNNLWAGGIRPTHIMVNLILPAHIKESRIKNIMSRIVDEALYHDVKIAGGHSEYADGLKAPIISVTAMGRPAGQMEAKDVIDKDIVMTKWMGICGTAILAQVKQQELCTRLPEKYVAAAAAMGRLCEVAPEAQKAIETGKVLAMHDVAGGGIYTALWELGKKLDCGLSVDIKAIPVMQETIEVCEFFDINPYRLKGDGSLLIVTEDGEGLANMLKEEGIAAAVIGKTTTGLDRVITREEERRFLESANGDEIYKVIC